MHMAAPRGGGRRARPPAAHKEGGPLRTGKVERERGRVTSRGTGTEGGYRRSKSLSSGNLKVLKNCPINGITFSAVHGTPRIPPM